MSALTERIVGRINRLRGGRGDAETPGERTGRQLAQLRSRVTELEAEVLETRQLARRIAELTDVVEQLLLTEDLRDPRRIEELLGQRRARD